MEFPEDLKYTEEHEWVRQEDDGLVTIGITDYAQDQLGDIVYLELPKDGEEVRKEETVGIVESVKTVSDLFAPISGMIVESNEPLLDSPEILNDDPYGEGWLLRIRPQDESELKDLMDSDQYAEYIAEQD